MESIVNLMNEGCTVAMPKDCRYKTASIRKDKDGFIWTLELNYEVTGQTGYKFPSDSKKQGYVKFYKTLSMCKKSLLKYIES